MTSSAKLVGRSAQVAAFDRSLAALARAQPVAVELAGEPGIGKTRLLAELAARAEERGHLVLRGSASELEGELPFGVFVDALDEYLQGLPPGVGVAQLRGRAPVRPSGDAAAEGAAAAGGADAGGDARTD